MESSTLMRKSIFVALDMLKHEKEFGLSVDGIEWLIKKFSTNYPENIIQPSFVCPIFAGCIRFEWNSKNIKNNIELEINTKTHRGILLIFKNNDHKIINLDLDDDNEWKQLLKYV